ncbi:MAG: hypothetical protein F6J95_023625 [Leptolyngbya sp. SIO1E4]|nr:hypothetical protein [Leptolyngbya sp. SIO1E4]
MPIPYTPDRELGWRGKVYPAGRPTLIPEDLAIALGFSSSPAQAQTEDEALAAQGAMAAAVQRLEELQLIYDAEGKRDWKAIKEIGDRLGVEKHPDGWDSSLLRIIEAEFSTAIAQALEGEV